MAPGVTSPDPSVLLVSLGASVRPGYLPLSGLWPESCFEKNQSAGR